MAWIFVVLMSVFLLRGLFWTWLAVRGRRTGQSQQGIAACLRIVVASLLASICFALTASSEGPPPVLVALGCVVPLVVQPLYEWIVAKKAS